MSTPERARGRLLRAVTMLALGFLVSACSAGATPSLGPSSSPLPSASLSPSSLPSPSPSTSPSPSPSSATDPAARLAIAAPYMLTTIDASQQSAFRSSTRIADVLAAANSLGIRMTGTGVESGDILVFAFPAGTLSDTWLKTTVAATASRLKIQFNTTTISGVMVSIESSGTGSVVIGFFRIGDRAIAVWTLSPTALTAIATALIAANH